MQRSHLPQPIRMEDSRRRRGSRSLWARSTSAWSVDQCVTLNAQKTTVWRCSAFVRFAYVLVSFVIWLILQIITVLLEFFNTNEKSHTCDIFCRRSLDGLWTGWIRMLNPGVTSPRVWRYHMMQGGRCPPSECRTKTMYLLAWRHSYPR